MCLSTLSFSPFLFLCIHLLIYPFVSIAIFCISRNLLHRWFFLSLTNTPASHELSFCLSRTPFLSLTNTLPVSHEHPICLTRTLFLFLTSCLSRTLFLLSLPVSHKHLFFLPLTNTHTCMVQRRWCWRWTHEHVSPQKNWNTICSFDLSVFKNI